MFNVHSSALVLLRQPDDIGGVFAHAGKSFFLPAVNQSKDTGQILYITIKNAEIYEKVNRFISRIRKPGFTLTLRGIIFACPPSQGEIRRGFCMGHCY
jgi:hypothetical protein